MSSVNHFVWEEHWYVFTVIHTGLQSNSGNWTCRRGFNLFPVNVATNMQVIICQKCHHLSRIAYSVTETEVATKVERRFVRNLASLLE